MAPLVDGGIAIAFSDTGEAATNVTGRLRRDAAYAGQIYIGADLDMDRIVGIGGGTIDSIPENASSGNARPGAGAL